MPFDQIDPMMNFTTDFTLALTVCLFLYKVFEFAKIEPLRTAAFFTIFVIVFAALDYVLYMPEQVVSKHCILLLLSLLLKIIWKTLLFNIILQDGRRRMYNTRRMLIAIKLSVSIIICLSAGMALDQLATTLGCQEIYNQLMGYFSYGFCPFAALWFGKFLLKLTME